MTLRLLEGVVPVRHRATLEEQLTGLPALGCWFDEIADRHVLVRVLLRTSDTEAVLDHLESHFGHISNFRLVLLPVEATLPRPEPSQEPPEADTDAGSGEKPAGSKAFGRISREELYADIVPGAQLSRNYFALTALATVVAAVGILRSNTAVVIGAMVIAPLLGPIMASSFAVTVGDVALARRALRTSLAGGLVALLLAVVTGVFIPVDPELPEVASRTQVRFDDVILALAAGSAGALSASAGVPGALIGVMVAVALLPPLVTVGLLIGARHWNQAGGAGLLFLVNWISMNLAGVVTFLAQGIRPTRWWEAEQARRATRRSVALWLFLLALLVVAIALSNR